MTTNDAGSRRKVILEDDVSGLHLAQALLLLAPEVEVLGFSAISGNVWRDAALARVCRALEITGRTDVPALAGSVFPLLNSEEATLRWEAAHGRLVWKGAWTRQRVEHTDEPELNAHAHDHVPDHPLGPATVVTARDEHAALFMLEQTRLHPGEITILATGPMTTLALAQALDSGFASRVKELVHMGGSLNPRQRRPGARAGQFAREFAHSPRREFNVRWDPEAARMVMRSPFPKMTMVPIDPSTGTELTADLRGALSKPDTALGRAFSWLDVGTPLWDEIASAIWLQPDLITTSAQMYIDVDCDPGAGYGNTLSWAPGYQPGLGEQLQNVVLEVDVAGLERLLIDRLAPATPDSAGLDVARQPG
ncbi:MULTISPECIES: nucleoside hydrolase [unclassified Microbacterium]|uniref:nucleoside hydrolase n=1 Tax=unclassified Microbacterium TaxID=2609290 RepID=UPI003017AE2F